MTYNIGGFNQKYKEIKAVINKRGFNQRYQEIRMEINTSGFNETVLM